MVEDETEEHSEIVEEWITGKKKKRKIIFAILIVIIMILAYGYWSYSEHLRTTPDNENADLSLELILYNTNLTIGINYMFHNNGERPAKYLDPGGSLGLSYSGGTLNPLLKVNITDSTGKSIGNIQYVEPEYELEKVIIYSGYEWKEGYTTLEHWKYHYGNTPSTLGTYDDNNTTSPYEINLFYDSRNVEFNDVWKGVLESNTIVLDELPHP